MADPLVSIILPTYNRLALLRESVDSVRAQTFADWELIVVDDGSDDGTAEYLEALAREEPRAHVLRLPHLGSSARVRNRGLARARGRWVAFQDSDDAWRADKLERHLQAHRDNPSARWSYSGRALMDASGAPLPDEQYRPWRPHSGKIARLMLTHEAMVAMPSLVVERALLEEIGGLDDSLPFSADFDLELRLAARAECVALPEPLVRVRLHPDSSTRGRVEVDESFIRVYAKFAAADGSAEVRRICRREQAHHALWVARKRMALGETGRALKAVFFAVRMHPSSPAPWRLLARWLAGPLLRRRAA